MDSQTQLNQSVADLANEITNSLPKFKSAQAADLDASVQATSAAASASAAAQSASQAVKAANAAAGSASTISNFTADAQAAVTQAQEYAADAHLERVGASVAAAAAASSATGAANSAAVASSSANTAMTSAATAVQAASTAAQAAVKAQPNSGADLVIISVGASPFAWTAPADGFVYVSGGNELTYTRNEVTFEITGSLVPIYKGDTLTVSFDSFIPAMTFVQR